MSGIEPNPGPKFSCGVCNASSYSMETYYEHYLSKHVSVPCMVPGCSFVSQTLPLLQMHWSRNHKSSQQLPSNPPCPVVPCHLPPQDSFTEHLVEHLALGQKFACPFNNCGAPQQQESSFKSHVSRHHKQEREASPLPPALASKRKDCDSVPSPHLPKKVKSTHPRLVTSASILSSAGTTAEESTEVVFSDPFVDPDSEPGDIFPPSIVKYAVLKFYLYLEGYKVVPSSTVQKICESIAKFTEMSHHCLEKAFQREMTTAGFQKTVIDEIISKVFLHDPVFNVHHKNCDTDQVSSIHLRREQIKKQFPISYVPSVEVFLGKDSAGRSKTAQFIPVRKSLESALKDPKVKAAIVRSFTKQPRSDGILGDYVDGSAFKEHRLLHPKCIHLVFFQDAFDFCPFGPALGLYKTLGMYFYIGNLPEDMRSQVDKIFMAFLLRDQHLKSTEKEHLDGVNMFQKNLAPLLEELSELHRNGIVIDGEVVPVCFVFCAGDNLGSHQIGSFALSFSAQYCCRYCPMSMTEFRATPWKCHALRTLEEYDNCVAVAKTKWEELKCKSVEFQNRRKQRAAELQKKIPTTAVSKSALAKLKSVHHLGIKPIPSALNTLPGYHVSNNGLPPCLGHDLFEGVVDLVLAKVFEHLIEEKKWFSLETLNRRIKSFRYKATDSADAPNAIKSYDGVKGHACETWTLLRLLPFIIGDLIEDESDEHWQLYLKLKEICEYVCAPRIAVKQVAYLQTIIEIYLAKVKDLLPQCLTPKHHYVAHYPALILIFGPLIRLFTLRFESKHVFFKAVGRACHSFKNILLTLAKKYQYKFVYDQMNGLIPEDVIYSSVPQKLDVNLLPQELQQDLSGLNLSTVDEVDVRGVTYKNLMWMVLDMKDLTDLRVGRIDKILIYPDSSVRFVLMFHVAENTYRGFYQIQTPARNAKILSLQDLPDYFPLPSYTFEGHQCLSLKHSLVFM